MYGNAQQSGCKANCFKQEATDKADKLSVSFFHVLKLMVLWYR